MRRQRREDSVLTCFSHEYVWSGQATPTVFMRETRIYGRSAAKEVLALSCVCVCCVVKTKPTGKEKRSQSL